MKRERVVNDFVSYLYHMYGVRQVDYFKECFCDRLPSNTVCQRCYSVQRFLRQYHPLSVEKSEEDFGEIFYFMFRGDDDEEIFIVLLDSKKQDAYIFDWAYLSIAKTQSSKEYYEVRRKVIDLISEFYGDHIEVYEHESLSGSS